MVRPSGPRDPIAGPPTPEPPFPLKLRGPVIKGYGRGSKELGVPTANIPLSGLSIGGHENLSSGIYYGFVSLDHSTIASNTTSTSVPSATADTSLPTSKSSNHAVADLEISTSQTSSATTTTTPSTSQSESQQQGPKVYPAVLSIGYNLYYKNSTRSIEIHVLHSFSEDFYGAMLRLVILGFIRPEYDYVSKEALVEDIREDVRVAQRSLEREGYLKYRGDGWLVGGEGGGGEGSEEVWGPKGAGQEGVVGVSRMQV